MAEPLTLTHQDVAARGIVDRYLRGDLPPAEAAAFEEHFFSCDVCFAELEESGRLAGAVRAADEAGWLVAPAERPKARVRWTWMPIAASLALAAATGWLGLVRVPALRAELADARAARNAAPAALAAAPQTVAANVPVAVLAAERGVTQAKTLAVPPGASEVLIWIEAPGTPSAGGARLEVTAADGRLVAAVDHLARNDSGAYVVALPSALTPVGDYRLRLYASSAAGAALLGDHVLRVTPAK